MSISAIGGSSTYASPTTTNFSTSRRRSSQDDPMSQAISTLQSTDPTLASKLTDLQKKVETMKKGGSSEKDVQSTIKSTMDGLSATEKGELQSAMPTPPSGGPGGAPPAGGHHHKKVVERRFGLFERRLDERDDVVQRDLRSSTRRSRCRTTRSWTWSRRAPTRRRRSLVGDPDPKGPRAPLREGR